jgi:heme exporter protein D
MDIVAALGRTIPFAFASGINLYATIAVMGLCSRFGLVDLPDQFRAFEHPAVIAGAVALYAIEFFADKIPWIDSLWDALHTVVRPVGGAIVAVTALGHATPAVQGLVALLGGSVALTTHLTKAGTRAVANTSPEPFSNWLLSTVEDVFAIGFSYVALSHPTLALTVCVVLLVVIALCASALIRAVRRRRARRHRQLA